MIWKSVAAALGVVAVVFGVLGLGPQIEPRQNLPEDVAELTDSAWERFGATFTAQSQCLTDVELELVPDLPAGAAEYLVADRLIRIEIPTSPRRYVETLTHELAHHIDAVCGAERSIGASFKTAQGLGSGVSWTSADDWEDRPMEHFAEAVVQIVTGDRYSHADIIELSPEAVNIVRRWATGST